MKNLIPEFILNKYNNNKLTGSFSGYTLFIDISGFTSMTQSLMTHGKEGAEILSKIISDIFTPAIESVYKNGGFVCSFAGDAFTSIFRVNRAEYPLRSAFEINSMFGEYGCLSTKFGDYRLEVKTGLSYGRIHYAIVDSKFQKAYYFRGDAIDKCALSEHHAGRMQIIADISFMKKISIKVKSKTAGKNWYQIIPEAFELPKYRKKKDLSIQKGTERYFVPKVILNLKERGEFREIVSCFVGFNENQEFHNAIEKIIKKCNDYGGYFNRVDFGDKGGVILVLFGAPTAMEKLYERASDFILSLHEISGFAFRAGMTAGIAFAGFIGSAVRCEYTAFGSMVNLSARLMMKAKPYEILADAGIVRGLSTIYEFKPKGLMSFKGFSDKIPIAGLAGRKSAQHMPAFTESFIGRQKETAELKKLISPVFHGKFGGIVYIDGPAGIGKSSFIASFTKEVENCSFFYFQCDEILKKSFNPFVYFLKEYFEQHETSSKEENKHKFSTIYQNIIDQTGIKEIKSELIRTKSLIGALIGHEWQNSLFSELDAKGRHENTKYALKNLIKAQSLIKPMVLILEDVHWIDSYSTELIKMIVINTERYPFIIIALCRINDDGSLFTLFSPGECNCRIKRLNITVFDNNMLTELLRDRLGADRIPENLKDFIWHKTGGNPFFIEQLILFLTENKLLDENFQLADKSMTIPSKINQVLIARIDRLSDTLKESIKTASVLGREFAVQLLTKLLINADIIKNENECIKYILDGCQEQIWENITEINYIFKHALIRDAVYETQLKERLRLLHDLAGTIIEDLYQKDIKAHYEELARHYEKAENIEKTIDYLEKSAIQSMDLYQNEKALNTFTRLLKYLDKDNDIPRMIPNLMKMGNISDLTGNWDEAIKYYRRAYDNSLITGNTEQTIDGIISIASMLRMKSNYAEAEDLLDKSLVLAEQTGYKTGIINIYGTLGSINLQKGDFKKALKAIKKQIKIAQDAGTKYMEGVSYGNCGVAYNNMGDNSKAMIYFHKQLEIANKMGNLRNYSITLGNMGVIYKDRRDFAKAMECFEKQLSVCKKIGDKHGIHTVFNGMGIVYYSLGDYEKAIDHYNRAMEISKEIEDINGLSFIYSNMGNVYFVTGNYEKAMDCYKKQMKINKETGNKAGLSKAFCYMGNIYRYRGRFREAGKLYRKYLSICREIGDETGVSIALCGIGIMYQENGDHEKALDYFNKFLSSSEKQKNKLNIGIALGNIANCYHSQGYTKKALEYHLRSLKISEELKSGKGTAITKGNIGKLYIELGDLGKALQYYQSQLEINEAIKNKKGTSSALSNMAFLMKEYCNYPLALKYIDDAIEIAEEIDIIYDLCDYLLIKAEILYMMEDKEGALLQIEKICKLSIGQKWTDISINAKLMKHKIKKNGRSLISMLKNKSLTKENKAEIYYELWNITKHEKYWSKALDIYNELQEKAQIHKYNKVIEELKSRGR